ncbi:putative ribonuclease III [Helianthus annuus]|nr:putative ribonuclease III [Helianthus annuus]
MEGVVAAIESVLSYTFNDKKLLEQALTHPSYTDAPSYERLKFLGGSVLQAAISAFLFSTYPGVEAGRLYHLRAVIGSNENFARVAVRHMLNKYIRHQKATVVSDQVWEFINAFEKEEETVSGRMKPPKVLADVVQSVAAAVYVDCGFNLQKMWTVSY